jgi:hypothetical protein
MFKKLFSRKTNEKQKEDIVTNKPELEQIIWPTLEELSSSVIAYYKLVQVGYDGKYYYRFAPFRKLVKAHPKTIEVAKLHRFPGILDTISGHPVALDVFVRELVEKGYDPLQINSVHGCNAESYQSPERSDKKKFIIKGMSATFGPPDYGILKSDMTISNPDYLDLYFKL